MRKTLFPLIAALLLILLGSCKKDKEHLSVFLDQDQIESRSASIKMRIEASGQWSVTLSEPWLKVSKQSGNGDQTLTLEVQENTGTQERTAVITVSGGNKPEELQLKQAGIPLILETRAIVFDEAGTPQELFIESHSNWEITNTDNVPWCRFSQTKGTTSTRVTLSPTPYENREVRGPAYILVLCGSESIPVKLSQVIQNTPPETPQLRYPVNAAAGISVWPRFEWAEAADPDGDPVSYEVLLCKEPGLWTVMGSNLTATEFQWESSERLERNRDYEWKVVATDAFGGNSESETVRFHTANFTPPVLLSPAYDELITDETEMKWTQSGWDEQEGASFSIFLSEDNEHWEELAHTQKTAYSFTATSRNPLYWKVAVSGNGEYVESEVSYFRQDINGYRDGETKLYQNNTAPNALFPVILIFTGDGYSIQELRYNGKFDKDMTKVIEGLFSIEPYKTYRDYFKVYIVAAESEQSGTTILKNISSKLPAMERNTAFSTVLDGGTSTGISGDNDKVFAYASEVPDIHQENDLYDTAIFVTVNVNAWAGTCWSYSSGRSIAYTAADYNLVGKIIHEGGGHGFGRLLDEYINNNGESIPAEDIERVTLWRQGNPWYYAGNIDFTNNRQTVHWKHYLNHPKYLSVGLYEGALLYSKGAWKAEKLSIMEDSEYFYLNAPSREAIVRRIMRVAGVEFSLQDFLAKDIHNPPPVTRTHTMKENYPADTPPVMIDDLGLK